GRPLVESLLIGVGGAMVLAEVLQCLPAADDRVAVPGVDLHDFVVESQRVLRPARCEKREAVAPPGFGVIGLDFESLPEGGRGIVEARALVEELAEREPRLRITALQ